MTLPQILLVKTSRTYLLQDSILFESNKIIMDDKIISKYLTQLYI